MLKNNINVTLGLDGPGSNNGQDMIECLKTTIMIHKISTTNPEAITVKEIIKMATINGAKALLKENEIGSLEVGKKADLFLFNYKMSNMIPINDLLSQIVYCGKAENIDTVIIDGKIVLRNRKLITLDETKFLDKIQELARNLISRVN